MNPIRILIIDSHPEVLSQIEARLGHESDFLVVGKSSDSAQIANSAQKYQPDIILIDPMMPDGSCLGLISKIKSELPSVAVVVLTAIVDTAFQLELDKVGVDKILPKGIDSDTLIETLREISESFME